MPVVSQSIIRPIVPVGASTEACALRYPWRSPSEIASSHDCFAADEHPLGHELAVDLLGRGAVLAHHAQHRVGVRLVPLERPHHLGDPRAGAVGLPGHQRRDRPGPRPAGVGVVREAPRHQQRAEVRVARARAGGYARAFSRDLLGRVVGLADHDLLRREHDLDGVLEARDVEGAVVVHELHQVQRRQVARASCRGACTREHGLEPLIRPDGRAGVPLVDRRVVLHARVGALPRGLRDLAHQVASADRLDRLAGRDGLELPVLVLLERPHELVGHAHRVVRVLILDRVRCPCRRGPCRTRRRAAPAPCAPRRPCTR